MDQGFIKNFISKPDASKALKVLWIIVVVASALGLGYYGKKNYVKLNVSPEILVKAQYVNSRTIPFPALTLCPSNFVNMEFTNVTKFFEDLENGTTPNEKDRKIITAASHICYHNFYFLNQSKDGISDPDNIVDVFNEVSPQFSDVFQGCVLTSSIKCEDIFIRSLTYQGKCFTFNMLGYHSVFNPGLSADFDGFKRKNITKSWRPFSEPEYHDDDKDNEHANWTVHTGYLTNHDWVQPLRAAGLQYIIMQTGINNTEIPNFCENIHFTYRIVIHLPNEVPTFSNVFTTFGIGQFKYMRITGEIQKMDESLKKYPPEFRKCYFEDEKQLKFLKSYTKLNCELECMTNFTYKSCGCVAFWMPRTDDMNVCKFKNVNCFTNIFYKWTSSYYEDDNNKLNYPDFPCNCLPTCTRIQYKIINEITNRKKESDETIISGMQLAFGDSQIMETTNYVTYTAENFVSDIGGLAGLFLGFSLLSLFELVVKAFEVIKKFIRKPDCMKENKQRKQRLFSKLRKRRTHKLHKRRRNVAQENVNPDVVVIDLLFGEHIKAER